LVLLLRDRQRLGHLIRGLLPPLAVLLDQLSRLALLGVGRLAAVGQEARGRGLQLDGDVGEERSDLLGRRVARLDLLILLLREAELARGVLQRELLLLPLLLEYVSQFHNSPPCERVGALEMT